jgi:hypothetical protein
MVAWSYSSLKTFQQCPKKYYHTRVAKDFKDEDSTATIYGKEVHRVAEEFIRDGTPIPEKYAFVKPVLESLNKIPGTKHCEIQFGLTEDLKPCGFFDENVWWRGVADLVVINGEEAYLVDYKTSKNAKYADTKQLDLLAAATFAHYPEVKRIKSALIFVVCNDFVKKNHVIEDASKYVAPFKFDLERLDNAMVTGTWNANSSALCPYCPVKTCQHWKEKRTR